jgi:hypothetical protein
MKRALAFLSLFTSVGTLLCCALPALFVVLGFGAAFAGLVGAVPQLVWLSENKLWLFGIGGLLLLVGGILQWRARMIACPVDSTLGEACATTRDWSKITYFLSLALYFAGGFFAFVLPKLLSS